LVRGEVIATSGYRANLVVSMIGWVVPFVMLALWRGAAADGPIEGVDQGQFTVYFGVVLVTTTLSLTGYLIYGFSPLVHDGRLAHYLQRPYHPFHNLVAEGLAHGIFRAATVAVLFAVLLGFVGGMVHTGSELPTAVMLWVVGSVASGYLAGLAGTIALWVTKAYGVQSLVIGAEGLLGGMYAPIRLLPAWLEVLSRHTPFWYSIGAPSELLAGITDTVDGLLAVVEAAGWIVALHFVFRRVWARGLLQFELVGG
jgi:ABC-2 type transport system permease protein